MQMMNSFFSVIDLDFRHKINVITNVRKPVALQKLLGEKYGTFIIHH